MSAFKGLLGQRRTVCGVSSKSRVRVFRYMTCPLVWTWRDVGVILFAILGVIVIVVEFLEAMAWGKP